MSAEALVRAEGLTRTFVAGANDVMAVAPTSFELRAGERVALVGPSGSGKSTLLHLIGGLDQPTGGSMSWPSLGGAAGLRPGPVGLAFQGQSLLPALDAIENVALPAILAGSDERQARIRAQELLQRFAVDDIAEHLPEEISGGQAQRVGLARAFVTNPRLVLVDEPTGQQDRASALLVLEMILTLAGEGDVAILIATHDAIVVERLPERWIMRDGFLHQGASACSA